MLREVRPDVVHAWNVHSHLSYDALRLAHRAGARVVHTYQDAQPFCYSKYKCWLDPNAPLPERSRLPRQPARLPKLPVSTTGRSRPGRRWSGPGSSGTWIAGVSVSAELAEALRQNGITVHEVVPNGLPLDDPALVGADGARARARHGWGDEPILVTGGRLHFFKGQLLAVDAFARVAASHPTARLVILGDKGEFRDRLEKHGGRATA